jgi:hypothetical protein
VPTLQGYKILPGRSVSTRYEFLSKYYSRTCGDVVMPLTLSHFTPNNAPLLKCLSEFYLSPLADYHEKFVSDVGCPDTNMNRLPSVSGLLL